MAQIDARFRGLVFTAAEWSATNPTLGAGEYGFESDTGIVKIGDGSTAYNSLSSIFKISAYALTLLNDADAATARATLAITKYATAWTSKTGWANAEITVTHNLGAALSDIFYQIFISVDGTEANAKSYGAGGAFIYTGPQYYNLQAFAIDTNSFKLQTGATGVMYLQEDGTSAAYTAGTAYYKVVVYRIG